MSGQEYNGAGDEQQGKAALASENEADLIPVPKGMRS